MGQAATARGKGERRWLAGLLLAGLLLRLPWLGTPGSPDMGVWKAWAYNTIHLGVTGVYTLRQKPEPPLSPTTVRETLAGKWPAGKIAYGGRAVYADYPPGTFYILWLVAGAYQAGVSPSFVDSPALNAAIKTPLLLAELGVTLLLWWALRRRAIGQPGRARHAGLIAAAAYWLNPAVILGGAVLAYLDALYGLALVAGVIALLAGRPRGLWAGWALALAFKTQALLLLPALLVLSARRGLGRLAGDGALAGAILLATALPFALAGHTLGILAGQVVNAHEEYISAYQFNIWWLWSYLYTATHGGGFGARTEILWQSRLARQGVGDLQPWGLALFAGFTLFLAGTWLWRQRRAAPGRPPGMEAVVLLALQLYGATMLLTSIHENHLLGAVPLLALAAGWATAGGGGPARGLWGLYAAISAIAGADLFMFYGLGGDPAQPPFQMWAGLDGSVLLTVLNIALFLVCAVLWARGYFAGDHPGAAAPAGEDRQPVSVPG